MNIFKDIITKLYSMRIKYSKSDPMNYIAKILMNSLYGRFGMADTFNEINIIDEDLLSEFIDNHLEYKIIDMIKFDNKYLVQYQSLEKIDDNNMNINIAIASAITSYSRIHMSQFKNRNDYKLFYSDTDSIYINKKLDENQINDKELGKLKLELTADKAIFISPKVYCLVSNDTTVMKVKGLAKEAISKIKVSDFEDLLTKDSTLKLSHEKWINYLIDNHISVKEYLYTLKMTSNKRELIYNSDNKLINTKPYNIKEI